MSLLGTPCIWARPERVPGCVLLATLHKFSESLGGVAHVLLGTGVLERLSPALCANCFQPGCKEVSRDETWLLMTCPGRSAHAPRRPQRHAVLLRAEGQKDLGCSGKETHEEKLKFLMIMDRVNCKCQLLSSKGFDELPSASKYRIDMVFKPNSPSFTWSFVDVDVQGYTVPMSIHRGQFTFAIVPFITRRCFPLPKDPRAQTYSGQVCPVRVPGSTARRLIFGIWPLGSPKPERGTVCTAGDTLAGSCHPIERNTACGSEALMCLKHQRNIAPQEEGTCETRGCLSLRLQVCT